jgi:hypothetical protein
MKRIMLVSCAIIAGIAMVSCTNDEVQTTPKNKQQVSTDDTGGGANGQTKIPPPK